MPKLTDELREYADIAEAGDKPHWAKAMREAARQLDWPESTAALRNGCLAEDLHVCGACDGTGYTT